MEHLKIFSNKDLAQLTNYRSGEIKFGEKVQILNSSENIDQFLFSSEAEFVLLGIPEDIGVRANGGRKGAASAWKDVIKSILNIQHNKFCKGSNLIILGYLDFKKEMEIADTLLLSDPEQKQIIYDLVSKIDKEVSHLISIIVKSGKIPIIVGGGHNNAYGNIKGTALAKGTPINAINFDAHSDFRILEGRHSGIENIRKNDDKIKFNTYEEIKIRHSKSFSKELENALTFISDDFYGVEVDLDSLIGVASSAMTPTGFSIEEARRFVDFFGRNKNAIYFHIAEGAPELADEKTQHLVGKLIAYLITDFMKSKSDL